MPKLFSKMIAISRPRSKPLSILPSMNEKGDNNALFVSQCLSLTIAQGFSSGAKQYSTQNMCVCLKKSPICVCIQWKCDDHLMSRRNFILFFPFLTYKVVNKSPYRGRCCCYCRGWLACQLRLMINSQSQSSIKLTQQQPNQRSHTLLKCFHLFSTFFSVQTNKESHLLGCAHIFDTIIEAITGSLYILCKKNM